MKLKCPKCLFEYDHRQATKDEAVVQMLEIIPVFVPHSGLMLEYLELFATIRPFKTAKLLRIMIEMRDMWTSERFSFQKRVYEISKQGIAQALKTVCNKRFDVPLENHNYLKKVMISISEQEAQKSSAAAERALKEKEARIRTSSPPENLHNFSKPAAIGEIKDILSGGGWKSEQ